MKMRVLVALLLLALLTATPAVAAPPESHELSLVKNSTLEKRKMQRATTPCKRPRGYNLFTVPVGIDLTARARTDPFHVS